MKFRQNYPPIYDCPLDYEMPRPPRRSGLFDLIGNIVGALCILGGIVLFVAVCHFSPDSAVIELLRNIL